MKRKSLYVFVVLSALAWFFPGALLNILPLPALAAAPPTVTTNAADNITSTSARLSGSLDSLGITLTANVSFQWGLSSGNYTSETTPQVMTAPGVFSANLTGLSANTTYYFRTKAVGDNMTAYGTEKSFTTASLEAPPPFLFKWGSLGSGDGQFNSPLGVAIDASGNVYVVDQYNYRIQKFTSSGQFITKWGSYGSGDGQFYLLYGIAVDASGNVYVADTENQRIQKFTSSGQFITKWGSYGNGDGQFNNPLCVAVDSSGNVYVTDYYNNRIQKFTSSGQFITKWGSYGSGDGQFYYPRGVAVDSSSNVYVADTDNHRFQKFTSTGAFITKWGSRGNGDGQFYDPMTVSVDSAGNVYVTEYSNHRIQVFGYAIPPTVTTGNATNITSSSAQLNGYLISLGTASTANLSFQWGLVSGNYTGVLSMGPFDTASFFFGADLTGLSPNTTYYFRAKAVGDGTSYGEERNFTTLTLSTDSGIWRSTGNMTQPRRDHTATLLTNGKVLIQGWYQTIAELYDPASGNFTLTGSTRFSHGQGATATQLLDGRILIVGGTHAQQSAEIYDPGTGTFTATGNLSVPHTNHTATLLTDGRVLIAAGQDNQGPVQTHAYAEIYDPATGNFTLTGSLNSHRSAHAAMLLPDGRVLIAGGLQTTTPGYGVTLKSTELYNPSSGTFTVAGNMTVERVFPTATPLSNGKFLIVGAGNTAELYDPVTGVFTATGNLIKPHGSHTATLLPNGQVLISGGASGPGTTNSAELYDPATGTFSTTASMVYPRQEHTATLLLTGKVLATGGWDGTTESNSAELYSPATTSWPTEVQVMIKAPAKVAPGRDFRATVGISQVVDLNGAQYDISFDPTVLQLVNVTAGQIGSTAMPVQGFAMVNPGVFRVLQARLETPYTVNGTGYLAVLNFHVIGSLGRSSPINLDNGILSGWVAEIPADWVGDFVEVAVIPGDADGNGIVNVLDLTKVVRMILLLEPETPGADANLDGVVNVLDLTKIVRLILMLD